MHWLWRIVITLAVGYVAGVLLAGSAFEAYSIITDALASIPPLLELMPVSNAGLYYHALFWFVPTLIVMALTFVFLPGRLKLRPTGQTRCRNCNHVLRNLTEPKCPECEEAI